MIEVLLVLALMAVVVGVFAINFDVLFKSIGEKRPEKVLYEAICEARYLVLQEHVPMYLSFDEKSHGFVIFKDVSEKPMVMMPLKEGIKVVFERIFPEEYKGGRFKEVSSKDKVIEKMAFFPDGSSQPVIITMGENNFSLKFKPDPVSCGIIAV